MLLDEGFIQISPSLQHRAAVKMIETLLRDPEYKSMMRRSSWNAREFRGRKCEVDKEVECIIEHLEMRVNTLSVPGALKTTLKRCIFYMTISTVQWLIRVAKSSPVRLRDQYWSGTVYELMNHLQWHSFGYVDSQKTLESYIRNRETIDFLIWNQLCLHCMEKEIRRFSKTIEWEKCEEVFFSPLSVYWYRKIYNRSPELEMCQPEVDEEICEVGESKEEILIERMFEYNNSAFFPRPALTVSGIKYFRNYLDDDGKFVALLKPTCFGDANDDVIFYLLRTIKTNDIFAMLPSCGFRMLGVIDPLFQLPLILFIDDWMSMFETLHINWFDHFFTALPTVRLGIQYDYKNKLYEAFEKVWRIYYERYSSNREEMGWAFCEILTHKDLTLCKLMLKGLEDHQRIHIIECGKDYAEQYRSYLPDEKEFLIQVLGQVLKNDEERELFAAIPEEDVISYEDLMASLRD